MDHQASLAVKSTIDTWHQQVDRFTKVLDGLTDEQLQKEVAPGRNRGIYLLGHLVAVHDRMLPLLNFGPATHTELDAIFVESPDRSATETPSAGELRGYWKQVNEKLAGHINGLTPGDWFQRHTAVSEEDFKKEPHRNRLNVLMSRTNHLSYHYGQLIFLKERKK
jgi:DinB superfamily